MHRLFVAAVLSAFAVTATAQEVVPAPLTPEGARQLIPTATTMTLDDLERITQAESPLSPDDFESQSFSILLMFAPADAERVGGSPPSPPDLIRAIHPGIDSKDSHLATEVHENYITECTCEVDGTRATGEFTWRVPGSAGAGGTARFTAVHTDGKWQIVVFALPNSGWRTVRHASGDWRIVKPASILNVVTDCGAVPNDGEPDTAAFELAVSMLTEQPAGGTMYIPAGSYDLERRLVFDGPRGPVRITGDGHNLTLVQWRGDAVAGIEIVLNNPEHAVVVRDLSLRRSQSGEKEDIAIRIVQKGGGKQSAKGSLLENLDIRGVNAAYEGWAKGVELVDVKHSLISNVHVTGQGEGEGDTVKSPVQLDDAGRHGRHARTLIGIEVRGTRNMSIEVHVRDCVVHFCRVAIGVYGAGEGGVVEGVYISESTAVQCGIGVQIAASSGRPGFWIRGCHFDYERSGVHLNGVSDTVLTDNLIYANGYAVMNHVGIQIEGEAHKSSDVIVRGNILANNSEAFETRHAVPGTAIAVQQCDRPAIVGNVLKRFQNGVHLGNRGDDAWVADNFIWGTAPHASVVNRVPQSGSHRTTIRDPLAGGTEFPASAHWVPLRPAPPGECPGCNTGR